MSQSVETQGTVTVIRSERRYTPLKTRPASRGHVSTFSRASRRRLIEMCARLNVEHVRMCFVTLTFSVSKAHEETYAALRRLFERFRRRWQDVAAVWRKELTAQGRIHYHLLTFNMPYIPQRELQDIWTDCTGEERSIVDIRRVRGGARQVMSYVAKYLAKCSRPGPTSLDNASYPHAGESESTGRWWGCFRREKLPWARRTVIVFNDPDAFGYLAWAIGKWSRGRAAIYKPSYRWYGQDGRDVLLWLLSYAEGFRWYREYAHGPPRTYVPDMPIQSPFVNR